jgi:hypothetical protein
MLYDGYLFIYLFIYFLVPKDIDEPYVFLCNTWDSTNHTIYSQFKKLLFFFLPLVNKSLLRPLSP